MGRTLRAPILKLDVNCMAAISNEKVSCTDVCITAGGCCGFAIGGVAGVFSGGGGGCNVSGMAAGDVGFRTKSSRERAFRCEWTGSIAAQPSIGDEITVG